MAVVLCGLHRRVKEPAAFHLCTPLRFVQERTKHKKWVNVEQNVKLSIPGGASTCRHPCFYTDVSSYFSISCLIGKNSHVEYFCLWSWQCKAQSMATQSGADFKRLFWSCLSGLVISWGRWCCAWKPWKDIVNQCLISAAFYLLSQPLIMAVLWCWKNFYCILLTNLLMCFI